MLPFCPRENPSRGRSAPPAWPARARSAPAHGRNPPARGTQSTEARASTALPSPPPGTEGAARCEPATSPGQSRDAVRDDIDDRPRVQCQTPFCPCPGGQKQGQYMDLNHFLRRRQRRRRQRRQPAIARPTAICAPSPPGGPASGAHRSECGGRSDGRRSTCPRALGRGGLWRARERWRRWPRPAGRTPRSACRAPPPRGRAEPRRRTLAADSGSTRF